MAADRFGERVVLVVGHRRVRRRAPARDAGAQLLGALRVPLRDGARRRERALVERSRRHVAGSPRRSAGSRSASARPRSRSAASRSRSSSRRSSTPGASRGRSVRSAPPASPRPSSAVSSCGRERPTTRSCTRGRRPLRDARVWSLAAGSALVVAPQMCVVGFAVLFLHDRRGLTPGTRRGRARRDPALRHRRADRCGTLVGRRRRPHRAAPGDRARERDADVRDRTARRRAAAGCSCRRSSSRACSR